MLNLNNSGPDSLRQAILSANAHVGADTINFDVAGSIRLTAALPAITGKTDLDGTSAPGFAGAPLVQIDFSHFGGLQFSSTAAGSAIRSLSLIRAASAGVAVKGGGDMLIVGNYIGVGLDGTSIAGNGGNGLEFKASSGNTIGGATVQDRNIISGNGKNGISFNGASLNQVLDNFIGTDVTGALDRGNLGNGILVTGAASGNIIGGSTANVISGNDANGVLITGSATLTSVSGNLIGLTVAGNVALGNHLDGVSVANANNNLIGHSDPITGVTYNNTDNFPSLPVSGWQGIRASDTPGQYLISGTSDDNGLLYEGTIDGAGASYSVNYPGALATSVYGPDNLSGNLLRLVGSYRNTDFATALVEVNGFVFEGTTADLANPANYTTIDYLGAKFNYVHSTMGGLAVGNYDSPLDPGDINLPLGPGHAYIYDIADHTFLTDVVFPHSLSNTAYGIWYNGGTSYTICGGYSLDAANNFDDQGHPIGQAYLVDYDSATGDFTNWKSFAYPNGVNFVTHFEGISSVENGVYTLNADSVQAGASDPSQGSWVTVRRNADGSFGAATWVDLNYPGVDPTTNITSSNSVFGNQVVGIVIGPDSGFSFEATINTAFQLSNVISGNGGNGVGLYGANNNQVAMNYLGTDVTGSIDLGNANNGVLLANGSQGNLIGGSATGGNDPTGGLFAPPPQGNLISGNNTNGVLLLSGATQNTLSGNFIGTTASGNTALGNTLDGVVFKSANGNSLIGCTFQQDPFVFYNVISGNGGNGVRVLNANDTTIQANFVGVGADNVSAVGNALNGVLVEGSSTNTVMGGPIPLGNVVAANGQNGIVVQGTASFFTSYNTFCGLAAFSGNLNLGNGGDGMLITSSGSNILIRTNVITRNGDNGIEIGGAAHGVRVVGNIIGLNTNASLPMGNLHNGVEVNGNASHIAIGGPQPTFNIIPYNIISANGDNGVAILDAAHDIQVNSGYIGTDFFGAIALGNGKAGVYIGAGTNATSVGSTDPSLLTVISGNLGDGVEMHGTYANTVVGSLIGTSATGLLPLPNAGSGVHISFSAGNTIGRAAGAAGGPANLIAFNGANGVFVESGNRNRIFGNSIYGNSLLGIDLAPGANLNQAAPVITSVSNLPLGVWLNGTLTSKANTVYTIEFFANDTAAASGRYSLGSQKVKTNAAGVAIFTFSGSPPLNGASFFTATATDPANNTSAFSPVASSVI